MVGHFNTCTCWSLRVSTWTDSSRQVLGQLHTTHTEWTRPKIALQVNRFNYKICNCKHHTFGHKWWHWNTIRMVKVTMFTKNRSFVSNSITCQCKNHQIDNIISLFDISYCLLDGESNSIYLFHFISWQNATWAGYIAHVAINKEIEIQLID